MGTKVSSVCSRRSFLAGSAAAGAVLGGLSLSGCGSNSARNGSVDADPKHTVTVCMTKESEPAAGFDPLVAWGCGEHVHEPLIQSTLITTNDKMGFEKDLARDYLCSDDGLVWTFTIRDDVKFTDGEPLTAADVAFTVNSIARSDKAEADLSMVREAVATEDYVVELHLSKPYNALLYTLAVMGIVPEHAYGKDYGAHPVGSGRYKLESWDKGQQAVFAANPDYYGEAPNIKRLVVVFMDEDAALAAAQAGQVDVAYTSALKADSVPSGYTLAAYKTVDSRGISLPCVPVGGTKQGDGGTPYPVGNNVTCDVAVRRAINLGLDRKVLIEHVLNGYGSVAFSVGDGMPWSSEDMRVATDVAAANKLLDDAGWAIGPDGVRAKDGQTAAFDVWYTAGDSARQAIVNEFAKQMADLGIKASPKGGSWDEIYPHEFEQPILWGWGSNAPVEVYELNYSSGWGNYACYESKTVDAYLDQALAQTNVEASYPYWKKAMWDGEEGVAPQDAATWVWMANVDHLYVVRDGLTVAAQKPHPHGHGWSIVNNVDKWSWA